MSICTHSRFSRPSQRHRSIRLVILCILLFAWPAYCTDYFVAPDGNDSNDGSIDHPLATIPEAVSRVSDGNTIFLRGGTYSYNDKISISKSGQDGNMITLQAYQNESVVLDYSGEPYGSSYRGFNVSGSYWHFKGFTIQYAGDNGINVTGAHNIFEQLVLRYNADSGFQLHTGSSYNTILNCDSYGNYDAPNHGENADGFAAKFTLGVGNEFIGCRSWGNSDDGWDCWEAGNAVTVENCWAFSNGVNVWGDTDFQGDGNGFKLGQGTGAHLLYWCVAYDNEHNGFDRNGNTTGTTVENCTSAANRGSNFRFDLDSSAFVLRNNISYSGTLNIASAVDDTYNTWNTGFSVGAGDFVSLDPNGIDGPREPDGSLPKLAFLRLSPDSALIDAGINVGLAHKGDAPDLGAFEYIPGDCHCDGTVDMKDLECFAANWLDTGCGTCNGANFDDYGGVDFYDFAMLAADWLEH
jgi:hypothetical protein